MNSMPLYLLIIAILFFSCEREKRFLVIEDSDFFFPPYRFQMMDGGDSLYSLTKRFYVYNYEDNKLEFDSIVKNMIFEAIRDSVPLSNCEFIFLQMPNNSKMYNEGDIQSPGFKKRIASFYWQIDKKNKIYSKWGDIYKPTIKVIEFNRDFDESNRIMSE